MLKFTIKLNEHSNVWTFVLSSTLEYRIVGFLRGEYFHEFRELSSVRENFTCKNYSSAQQLETSHVYLGMALFKYFKNTDDKAHSVLPNPQGSLSVIACTSNFTINDVLLFARRSSKQLI